MKILIRGGSESKAGERCVQLALEIVCVGCDGAYLIDAPHSPELGNM